jgi:acyl carrier protein
VDLNNLELHIKSFIIERLQLELIPDDIGNDQILFGKTEGSLGLDSVDALELVVGIRMNYGIVVQEDLDPREFMTVAAISNFIRANLNSQQLNQEAQNV